MHIRRGKRRFPMAHYNGGVEALRAAMLQEVPDFYLWLSRRSITRDMTRGYRSAKYHSMVEEQLSEWAKCAESLVRDLSDESKPISIKKIQEHLRSEEQVCPGIHKIAKHFRSRKAQGFEVSQHGNVYEFWFAGSARTIAFPMVHATTAIAPPATVRAINL